ncbi:MAG: hypothetical protein JNL83_04285 [Myxococcales bacterium]|nr:hypothetical protein [Myxococcales bacterium]
MKNLVLLASCVFAAACGDDGGSTNPDASMPDAAADAAIDAPVSTYTPPMAQSFGYSAAGHDQVQAATAGPNGGWYTVGWRAADVQATTPRTIIVTKLLPSGMPDMTWGTAGTVDTLVPFKGGNDELDIAVYGGTGAQAGKIVVSAVVAAQTVNPVDAADTDVAILRLTAAGALDTTFDSDGIVYHNFNTSLPVVSGTNTTFPGRDTVRGLALQDNGALFLHGSQRAEGDITGMPGSPRSDSDFLVAKLTDAGALDTAWGGGDGKFLQDIYFNNTHTNATARGIFTIAGAMGEVLAGGYATSGISGTGGGPQAVLYRLTNTGTLKTSFNPTGPVPGLFHDVVLALQTEVYNVAIHGSNVVTGGYGRNTGTNNDFISLRFNLDTGARDTTWGAPAFTDGKVFFDPTPADNLAGSNCHSAVALPGGKTLLIGSSNRTTTNGGANPEVRDAVFAVLTATGTLDTTFGTGVNTYKLGDDGADQFWGAAVNGNKVLIVGYRGTKGTASATNNDDAYSVVLPL